MTTAESRLQKLGITLAAPPPLSGPVVRSKRSGNHLYLSGQGPAAAADGSRPAGKVGADLTLDQGYEAARLVGLGLLGQIRDTIGSLDRVTSVIKVLGFVNCAPGFDRASQVINGCSDLFVEVFGEAIGRHARSAIGASELPNAYPVEIEAIIEIGEETSE